MGYLRAPGRIAPEALAAVLGRLQAVVPTGMHQRKADAAPIGELLAERAIDTSQTPPDQTEFTAKSNTQPEPNAGVNRQGRPPHGLCSQEP